jgi:hypothetical protein
MIFLSLPSRINSFLAFHKQHELKNFFYEQHQKNISHIDVLIKICKLFDSTNFDTVNHEQHIVKIG